MSTGRADLDRVGVERWLAEDFASSLAAAIEAMAGDHVNITCTPNSTAPGDGNLLWKQSLTPFPGAILVGVAEDGWSAIGDHILSAAGVEGSETTERKSTCLEVIGQAFAGLARSITARLKKEVTCVDGTEIVEVPPGGNWTGVSMTLGETPVTVTFGSEPALLDALVQALNEAAAPAAHPALTPGAPVQPSSDGARTFDLLLDVELPVSVSFGHAQVLLKDVLKLTTGSIVELDRAIVEPVDIVVNNCVIARGEVVVVEGNFGVRIQHVVSPEERARSIQ